jgi:hypothetical protein
MRRNLQFLLRAEREQDGLTDRIGPLRGPAHLRLGFDFSE